MRKTPCLSEALSNTSLEELSVENIVPVLKIEDMLGVELEHEVIRGGMLMNELTGGRPDFNNPVEKSISRLCVKYDLLFPQEFQYLSNSPNFYSTVLSYITAINQKTGMGFEYPPASQILFRARVKGSDVHDEKNYAYSIHLADVLFNELYLDDIFLGNPMMMHASGGHVGLGHGIFDEILSNIEEYARTREYDAISLEAFKPQNRDAFIKRGFHVEDNIYGKHALLTGYGFPMRKVIS